VTAGIRKDVLCRVIVTAKPEGIIGFFSLFAGRRWEMTASGIREDHATGYQKTYQASSAVIVAG